MGNIRDEDIALFMNDKDIKNILNSIDSEINTQSIIVNIILYLFNSPNLYNNDDWIQQIIIIINDRKLSNFILAPCLRNVDIEKSLHYIIDKLRVLENNEELNFNGVRISYEIFNQFVDALYEWFLEMNFKTLSD